MFFVPCDIERDAAFFTIYQTPLDFLPCTDRDLKIRQTGNQDRLLFFFYPDIFPAIISSGRLKHIAPNHGGDIVKGIFIRAITAEFFRESINHCEAFYRVIKCALFDNWVNWVLLIFSTKLSIAFYYNCNHINYYTY